MAHSGHPYVWEIGRLVKHRISSYLVGLLVT
jgi:hypothetical protein